MMITKTCLDGGSGSATQKKALVSNVVGMYRHYVAAKSVTGRGNPFKQKAHSAQDSISGVFLCLRFRFMAAVRGQTSVWPGSFCPGISTPRIAATQSRGKDRGSSSKAKGAPPMLTTTQDPSVLIGKANAHRAMAMAALQKNSSLSVRLRRYNHHVEIARSLEAQAVAK